MRLKVTFFFLVPCFITETVQGTEIFNSVSNYGIFGGQDAVEGQFPYQVSIQVCSTFFAWKICEHFCGGSIIAPNWILTAGHCYDVGIETQIVAGLVNRSEESSFKQTIGVNQTFVHKDYIGNANPNDIRLYQLKAPLVYNERVQAIALPIQNYNTTGEAILSGWGYTKNSLFPSPPETLQYQIANMPDGETCHKLANAISTNYFNSTTNVCTENPEENHGICSGDSGGPLVQNGTLIGISSWGFVPCGQKNAPSVYTRVSNYIDWIKERVPEL